MALLFKLQNRILWIDEKNLTAHVEAGIVGQDLERLVSTVMFTHVKSLLTFLQNVATVELRDHLHAGCSYSVTLVLSSQGISQELGRSMRQEQSTEWERLESEAAVMSRWHHQANSEKWGRSECLM